MKSILIFSAILVFVSLSVSGNPKYEIYLGFSANGNVQPSRTFKPVSADRRNENVNFKPALFTVTQATLGKKADLSAYSLYFSGTIEITPGGNKFWDLAGNTEIIDEIDQQQEIAINSNHSFTDCQFNKKVNLTVLGQGVTATEYYLIGDGGISAKGMSLVAQSLTNSGITITIPVQEVLYTPSKLVCYFPLTYDGTTHTIPPYTRTIIAKVSGASALGIPDGTTVSYSVTFNDSYKVLAWGGLQLIDNEKPVNALLIQTESKTVGTILINGAKVPQSVLSSLKMTQDSASVSVNYSFRNMTYPDNVAEFGLAGDKVTYLTTIKAIK